MIQIEICRRATRRGREPIFLWRIRHSTGLVPVPWSPMILLYMLCAFQRAKKYHHSTHRSLPYIQNCSYNIHLFNKIALDLVYVANHPNDVLRGTHQAPASNTDPAPRKMPTEKTNWTYSESSSINPSSCGPSHTRPSSQWLHACVVPLPYMISARGWRIPPCREGCLILRCLRWMMGTLWAIPQGY